MVTKMNRNVLYIPRPGWSSMAIRDGYVDALSSLGYAVYVCDPKAKLPCREFIEHHNIGVIMTHSKYGIRQLPIDAINELGIAVFVEILPLNDRGLTIGGPNEMAHKDEPSTLNRIDRCCAHTRIEKHIWQDYMSVWIDNGVKIIHNPAAGNIIRAMPESFDTLTDIAMVANFSHRQGIMRKKIAPLFKHAERLGYSYQAFGDDIWARAGLNYNGILDPKESKIANIYSTSIVCPNVHTEEQVDLQAVVNDRAFMIPLCGGVQISDQPLISKYIGSYCYNANSINDFMTKILDRIATDDIKYDDIKIGINEVAHSHTYFNRLCLLFSEAGLSEESEYIKSGIYNRAFSYCWEIEARISAKERGVQYESSVACTT